MRYFPGNQAKREGAIAPLTAVLCIFLVAMVAFAVDLAWMVLTESELQSAADAAALAGAQELLDPYVQYQLPGQSDNAKKTILTNALTKARTTAKNYASYNGAGGKNTLALRDEDIEFGFTNENGTYSTTYTGFPNSIKLLIRRDTTSNGSLPLFFGPALGTKSANLQATASATLYAGAVDGLSGNGIAMLPMTFDVDHWDNFLKTGKDADGKISYAADGTPQLMVYPTFSDKGNFGQLALDDAHAGSSEIREWIDDGINQDDINELLGSGLIPLSARGVGTSDWLGNPGLRSSTIQSVNDHAGKEYILPLFKALNSDPTNYEPGTGEGSHYNYNIVGFVGIKIMQTDKSNREIIVVPSAIIDPGLVFAPGSVVPAGTSGRFETTFTVPKLSR